MTSTNSGSSSKSKEFGSGSKIVVKETRSIFSTRTATDWKRTWAR